MRIFLATFLLVACAARPMPAEIRDVLKSDDIETLFARTETSLIVHEEPHYAVVFRVNEGKPGPYQVHRGADEVWFVRRGTARLSLGRELTNPRELSQGELVGSGIPTPRHHDVRAGDVVNLPRRTAYQLDPGSGSFEYVAVRIFPTGAHPLRRFGEPQHMPQVLKKSEIDATFANFDRNQPLHSVRNYSINYVIYQGRSGPWEAHRGCVDIYFVHTGAAQAHLGGEIANPKEEIPGEIRGTGVAGARTSEIGPGDIVLIPRNTAHYMVPTSGKLGYLLVKVWAQ